MIKILFVGEGRVQMYEKAFYEAAMGIEGLESHLYTWSETIDRLRKTVLGKAENKLAFGHAINKINNGLIELCRGEKYDVVFLYSCRVIYKRTLSEVRKFVKCLITYNNDNPFSDSYPKYFWRHWRKGLSFCDLVYVYRQSNIDDCKKKGINNANLLRSYYNSDRIYYIPDDQIDIDVPNVLFLGHNENDERGEYIKYLTDNGIKIGIPDIDEWKHFEPGNLNVVRLKNTHEQYNEMINKAKICLVFLSKLNHDTYTRRCFEIPAVKTLMMSVYTDDIASMFEKDKEVIFFESKEELYEKVKYFLKHTDECNEISEAGYKRVKAGKHSAEDRVRTIIADYQSWEKNIDK